MAMMKRQCRIILAICLISLLLAGCVKKIEITDQTIKAGKMKAGQAYTAPTEGWFISDEGIYRMLYAIEYYRYKWEECEASR